MVVLSHQRILFLTVTGGDFIQLFFNPGCWPSRTFSHLITWPSVLRDGRISFFLGQVEEEWWSFQTSSTSDWWRRSVEGRLKLITAALTRNWLVLCGSKLLTPHKNDCSAPSLAIDIFKHTVVSNICCTEAANVTHLLERLHPHCELMRRAPRIPPEICGMKSWLFEQDLN